MKIKDITLINFGKYKQVSASFSDAVTYLVGPNGSGKSGLGYVGVNFMFEGMAEKASKGGSPVIAERFRFIGPDAKSSKGFMTLYDECNPGVEIKVYRTLTKDGNTVRFEGPAGMKLDQAWLTSLFNEFMIAPKRFVALSAIDQARALGIDTTTYDKNIQALKDEKTDLGRELKSLGDLEPVEKVEEVSLQDLQVEQERVRADLNRQYQDNKSANAALKAQYEAEKKAMEDKIKAHDDKVYEMTENWKTGLDALATLIAATGYDGQEVRKHLEWYESTIKKKITPEQRTKLIPAEPQYLEEMPGDEPLQDVNRRIMSASQTNIKSAAYREYLKKLDKRNDLQRQLEENKKKQTEEAEKRLEYIKSLPFPFDNLSVDEDGGLLFDNKPIKEPYFSSGELIKMVPILMSSLNGALKFVFIQDFNLLDEQKQQDVEDYLTQAGFQLVIEYVGTSPIESKNCLTMSDITIEHKTEQQ